MGIMFGLNFNKEYKKLSNKDKKNILIQIKYAIVEHRRGSGVSDPPCEEKITIIMGIEAYHKMLKQNQNLINIRLGNTQTIEGNRLIVLRTTLEFEFIGTRFGVEKPEHFNIKCCGAGCQRRW